MASTEIQYYEVVSLIHRQHCPTQTCPAGTGFSHGFASLFFFFSRLNCASLGVLKFLGKESFFLLRSVQLSAKIIELRLQVRSRRCRSRAGSRRHIRISLIFMLGGLQGSELLVVL